MDLFTLVGKIVLDADEFGEKIDSAMSKVESLGTKMQNAGQKISSVGSNLTKAFTVPLTAMGTASVVTAASFEDGMLKVQSLSGATQEEYKQLSEAAKNMEHRRPGQQRMLRMQWDIWLLPGLIPRKFWRVQAVCFRSRLHQEKTLQR